MIEGSDAHELGLPTLLVREAHELGLQVVPAFRSMAVLERRLYTYAYASELPLHEDYDQFRNDLISKTGIDPGKTRQESTNRYFALYKIMGNMLLRRILAHEPDLIIAGAGHIDDVKKWVPNSIDKTPEEVKQYSEPLLEHFTSSVSKHDEIVQAISLKRKKILEMYARRKKPRGWLRAILFPK